MFNLIFILLQSCNNESNNKFNIIAKSEIALNNTTKDNLNGAKYSLNIEQIDSLNFFSVKAKSDYTYDTFLKIVDFNVAKQQLKNIAEFEEGDLEYPLVVKLSDRQNNIIEINDDYGFVAYYPEEDILLCEGGHSTDVSFNLKNGEGTELTGNPDIIKSSPTKKYRLNGHFGGQQCSSYFIQRRSKDGYQKIIQLDEEFEEITKIWLCVIGDAFWINDTTFYLTENSSFEYDTKYFKIEIIEEK